MNGVKIWIKEIVSTTNFSINFISMNPQNKATMNFKSLPTTSEQQSQTLLKAGLNPKTADCLVGTHLEDNPIECAVSMIGWLIRKNHFNKEYLKKK